MPELNIKALSSQHVGPVTFTLQGGETLLISGASGSGKSILLRALADLDQHTGELTLDDQSCALTPPTEWRRRVGLLSAESQWWHETVGEHFPPDYRFAQLGFDDTVKNWSISRLSTGEKQRLAILRLLVNRPVVLLLDEPTASLDQKNTLAVEKHIAEYQSANNAIVIWVSHDEQQMSRINGHMCRMHEGTLLGCQE